MIEWATRPYYTPRGAIYEARLMEAAFVNALHRAGVNFGERLHYWHGNLLFLTAIGHDSIPGNWPIAKRRYLEKCVDHSIAGASPRKPRPPSASSGLRPSRAAG